MKFKDCENEIRELVSFVFCYKLGKFSDAL